MRRWGYYIGLLGVSGVAGLALGLHSGVTESSAGQATDGSPGASSVSIPSIDECVSMWNSPQNEALRASMNPPSGKFPQSESGDSLSPVPEGPYTVHVAVSLHPGVPESTSTSDASVSPGASCSVFFFYPDGLGKGDPAMLSAQSDANGYQQSLVSMTVGLDTDISGTPVALQDSSGSLCLTPCTVAR
jgi:hypothetical protein